MQLPTTDYEVHFGIWCRICQRDLGISARVAAPAPADGPGFLVLIDQVEGGCQHTAKWLPRSIRNANHTIHLCDRPYHRCCDIDTSEYLGEPLHVAQWMLHGENGTYTHSLATDDHQLPPCNRLLHDVTSFRCFRCGAIAAIESVSQQCRVCTQNICQQCWDVTSLRCIQCTEHAEATKYPASDGRCPLCDAQKPIKICFGCNRVICHICFDVPNQRCTECIETSLLESEEGSP